MTTEKQISAYILILPISLIVTYSQLIVKWRANAIADFAAVSFPRQLLKFLTDPVMLSAYGAALFASFAWLYVVTKLPLTVAFPAYIGLTFALVLIGGGVFLGENLTPLKIIAVLLIMAGIILGVYADA
jgi:multidrug transporter EmrE-like cation transporter